jgi:hypothetical protein
MNSPPPPRHDDRARHKRQGQDGDQGSDQHGIERNTRGEEQPTDKERARQTSYGEESGGRERPPSPGEPAGGE